MHAPRWRVCCASWPTGSPPSPTWVSRWTASFSSAGPLDPRPCRSSRLRCSASRSTCLPRRSTSLTAPPGRLPGSSAVLMHLPSGARKPPAPTPAPLTPPSSTATARQPLACSRPGVDDRTMPELLARGPEPRTTVVDRVRATWSGHEECNGRVTLKIDAERSGGAVEELDEPPGCAHGQSREDPDEHP